MTLSLILLILVGWWLSVLAALGGILMLLAVSERFFRWFSDRILVRFVRRESATPPFRDQYWY
jgi:hypothetical protein